MSSRKVFEEQAEFAQAFCGHEVSVVDDGDEHFAGTVEAEGVGHELTFAVVIVTLEVDGKGLAKDAQGVVVGVQCAVEHGGDEAFGIVLKESGFKDALAGARFTENQAKSALLGMDEEDV